MDETGSQFFMCAACKVLRSKTGVVEEGIKHIQEFSLPAQLSSVSFREILAERRDMVIDKTSQNVVIQKLLLTGSFWHVERVDKFGYFLHQAQKHVVQVLKLLGLRTNVNQTLKCSWRPQNRFLMHWKFCLWSLAKIFCWIFCVLFLHRSWSMTVSSDQAAAISFFSLQPKRMVSTFLSWNGSGCDLCRMVFQSLAATLVKAGQVREEESWGLDIEVVAWTPGQHAAQQLKRL